MTLRAEIAEQPAVIERLVRDGRPAIEAIAAGVAPRIASGAIDFVLVAARGTSDHAAIYAQYLFGERLGLPVALAAPSLLSLYGAEPRVGRALVVAISQSGRSPDVVAVVASARDQGAPTIAITNEPNSDLARAAEHMIDLAAGPERAVAATKTYTSQLTAVAMLVAALEGAGAAWDDLGRLPAALAAAAAPDREREVESIAARLAAHDRLIVIGRGFDYATARELALKLKELARVSADPYSTADFLHGPLALVEPGLPVIAIAPSGRAALDVDAVLERLAGLGVERIVLSDRAGALASASAGISLPAGVPDRLMPVASIVPGQLLALHVALARGIDPEAPRWIEKVTLTR
jgi:glucosamine--fructose-6-phosphate aminotransferase (isomerizing)